MPELPEVEVVKKSLNKSIYHLTLKNIEIRNKFLRFKINTKLMKKMVGSKVISINRRSKYIIIKFDNNYTILIHLGMTGKFIIFDSKNIKRNSSFYHKLADHKLKHDHLIFKFNKKIKLVYNDIRKFGFLKVEKTKKLNLNSHLKKLGPEPLSKSFSFHYFKKKIIQRKLSIKDLLMDQKFVAGLGNIYVNEAIFQSKINPIMQVRNLNDKKISSLIRNIKKILNKAIKEGGSSIKDFNNIEGKEGNFQQFFNVYGRNGMHCTRAKCRGIVNKIKISNRSTFFCSICQK
tara:strand:- start:158 stop:1024 length:867 start_codon:yes stop_codon:yes gene_type:complete